MDDHIETLKRVYERFSARDIDGVFVALADDVAWANGMDGGHVHGLEAVRAYWSRQWRLISPHVEPLGFRRMANGGIEVDVRQTINDLEGKPLADSNSGLKDKTVGHIFHFRGDKVIRFDIRDAA